MKKILSTFLLPVCLVLIAVLTFYNYIQNGAIMFGQLGILFALIPRALVSIKPEISSNPNFKYFRIVMLIIAICMIFFGVKELL